MSSTEESIIGHKEQLLDPERQIELLRRCLRGEKHLTYSTPGTIIFAARAAVDKAMDVVYTIGALKGQRKYTNSEIDEMRAEFHRLEDLLKRKNKGENIGREIDAPLTEEKSDKQKQEPIIFKKPEISSDAPEIVKIKALIDDAVAYYSKRNTAEANKTFREAAKRIKEAELKGIDVTDVVREKDSLSTFFQNQ